MESPEDWMKKSLNIKVPDGLDDLLEEIIRAVLKAQPTHLENFIANHVKKLLEIRESASLRSSQHSPEEQDKKFAESNAAILATDTVQEKKQDTTKKTAPIVSEETSPADEDEDDEDAGSLGTSQSIPLIDATAVKTLAASTGTVAILGTTAKCSENNVAGGSVKAVEPSARSIAAEESSSQQPTKIPCAPTYASEVATPPTSTKTKQKVDEHSSSTATNIITTKAIIETRKISDHDEIIIPNDDDGSSKKPLSTTADIKPTITMEFGEIEKKTFRSPKHSSTTPPPLQQHKEDKPPVTTRTKVPTTLEIIPVVNTLQQPSERPKSAVAPSLSDKKFLPEKRQQIDGTSSKGLQSASVDKNMVGGPSDSSSIISKGKSTAVIKSIVTNTEPISPPIRDTTLLPSQWEVTTTKVPTADGGFTLVETVLTTEEEIRKRNELREQKLEEIAKTMMDTQYEIRKELYELERRARSDDESPPDDGEEYDSGEGISPELSDERQIVFDEKPKTDNNVEVVQKVDEPLPPLITTVEVKIAELEVSAAEKKLIIPSAEKDKELPSSSSSAAVAAAKNAVPSADKLSTSESTTDNSKMETEKLPIIVAESIKKKESPKSDYLTESDRTSDSEKDNSTSNDIVSVISEIKDEVRSSVEQPTAVVVDVDKSTKEESSVISKESAVEETRSETVKTESVTKTSLLLSGQLLLKKESFEIEDYNDKIAASTEVVVESKENESPSAGEEAGREISSTSLNTLGEDDSQISDLEVDIPSKKITTTVERSALRRFDTISSNGETSYNVSPVQEEGNLSSLAEELSEQLELLELENLAKETYQMDENIAESRKLAPENLPEIIETVKEEVDRICERAIEKTTTYLNQQQKQPTMMMMINKDTLDLRDIEDGNNVSECSAISAIDSVVAEKGSDFDSLSFLDEQSDSRPLSIVSMEKEDTKVEYVGHKLEYAQELLTDQEDDISFTALPDIQPPSLIQEDLSSADTEKTAVDSVSDDLPKPPELDEFPLPPENVDDQFDIAEEDIKSVQLPSQKDEDNNVAAIIKQQQPPSANMEHEDLSSAIVKIQAGVRGYLTRKQIKVIRPEGSDKPSSELSEADAAAFKDHLKGKRMSLDSKLGDYENIRRYSKLRTTLSECKEDEAEYGANNNNPESRFKNLAAEDEAAKKIQNTFRHYRARKSISGGTVVSGGQQAAMTAQLNGRPSDKFDGGDVKTTELVVGRKIEGGKLLPNGNIAQQNGLEKSPEKLQLKQIDGVENVKDVDAIVNLEGNKKRAISDKADSTTMVSSEPATTASTSGAANLDAAKKTIEQQEAEEEESAVRKIQAVFRFKKTKQQRQSVQLTSAAAIKIQANFRGYKVRKELKKSNSVGDLHGPNDSPSSRSGSNTSVNVEEKCAAKIQAGFRGYLVRKRHSLQNNAAVKIQTNYRKYKSKKQEDEQQSTSQKTCDDQVVADDDGKR